MAPKTEKWNNDIQLSVGKGGELLLEICEISGKLVTVLTQVGARNSITCAATVIFHGPMKSTVTSEHCKNNAFLGGSSPKTSTR